MVVVFQFDTEIHEKQYLIVSAFKNITDRLAQAVLARENPKETFLKEMPSGQGEVQVIFPVSILFYSFPIPY